MRDALMSTWAGELPEWLSGHAADGSPSRQPHLAVVPLANLGFEYSEQARESWHGLALVLPRAIEDDWLSGETPTAYANGERLRGALVHLTDRASNTIPLQLGRLGVARLRQVEGAAADKKSLKPGRYVSQSRVWSTGTPIVLDRHTKGEHRREEMAEIIAESCMRIDLPKPLRVHVHKHAAITGAPSAWPPGGAPEWTAWSRPGALASRQLTHATLHFAEPVGGPLLLGAGRFFGLGLCLPVTQGRQA
jgi:CRISPR-associated protein Csb2